MLCHARRSAVVTVLVADAAVAIRGDLSKFSGDLKKAETQTESLGGKLNAALSPKALVGGLAGAFAVTKVIDFLGDAIGAASDLNETISKTGVILGEEALPGLERWAEGAALAFGQSKQQALDAASTFAIFGKSAGLAGDDLVGFSTELTELSADFASFFNTSPEDAITAIGAALRGESEPIRRYGVLLDDATLRQRAFKLGLIETTTQALLPQQRVLAAQAEILAQTSDAQGDFTRTSEGQANQTRILNAQLENLTVRIGQKLQPVFLKLLKVINDLAPALDFLADSLGNLTDAATGAAPVRALDKLMLDLSDVVERPRRAVEAEAARWAGNIRSFTTAIEAGEPDMRDSSEYAIGLPITDALRDARMKAAAEARAIPGDISRALIAGLQDIEDGLDALKELMENSLSDAAKIAKLKGILASSELAAGLRDERADVRGAAMQLRDEALEELALLESGAYDAAVDTGTTIAEQLRQQESVIRQGMIDALRGARSVLAEGWATPEVPVPRLLGGRLEGNEDFPAPTSGGGSNNVVNNNLTVNGVPYRFDTRDDFISALDDLSAFGDGRVGGV